MSALDESEFDDAEDGDDEDSVESSELGSFAYALNPRHYIRFERRGPGLLVTFDAVEDDQTDLSEHSARLDDLAREMEWSTLSLASRGQTWFRDPEVINFFDVLVDGMLFDQFEDVLFYGSGSGAHAALSFALCAPLCRVLALSPQATLGDGAPWDTRFDLPAGIDFAKRYPPTPENLEAAESVFVSYDPTSPEDRRHAAMLDSAVTHPLQCRHMDQQIEEHLAQLGVLDDLVVEAMGGTLDAITFYTALRARRDDPRYLRRLVGRLIDAQRPLLEALVVRNIGERTGRNRYRRRFERVNAQLREQGITVPDRRT